MTPPSDRKAWSVTLSAMTLPAVTFLRFTYFDQNGNQLASDLDGKSTGAALDLAPRTQRDAVRTIVITLQITEQVVQHAVGQTPRQPDQVYTLTSTVRLRNIANT